MGKNSLVNIWIGILVCSGLLLSTNCFLKNIIINMTDNQINHLSNHTWTINYSASNIRTNFQLYFPACVNLNTVTVVVDSNGSQISINKSSLYTGLNFSSINFSSSPKNSTTYSFIVVNVTNCYYSKKFSN
jgi:hypothetical protein